MDSYSDWTLYTYNVALHHAIPVIGHGDTLFRKGFVVGTYRKNQWTFAEVAPLPSFHQTTYNTVLDDIIHSFSTHSKAQSGLVQFAQYSLEQTHSKECMDGIVTCNSLLSLDSWQDNIPKKTPTHLPTQRNKCHTLKIKLGRDNIDKELACLQEISTFAREKSLHYTLRLDANRQWNKEQLLYFWSQYTQTIACDNIRLEYFEEPIHPNKDMIGCSPIPLALDESLDQEYLLEYPHIAHAVIKPTLHTNWQTISKLYPHISCTISSTFETSLGMWQLGQLALSYPNTTHGLGTLKYLAEDIVQNPLLYREQMLHIPSKPPTIDWSKLEFLAGIAV